jgi:hypothetical protein
MNYALLAKYRHTSDSQDLDKTYHELVSLMISLKTTECYEIAVYLSNVDPNVLFGMGLWFTLDQLAQIGEHTAALRERHHIELVEFNIFKLIRQYRRMDLKIEASHLRLYTFPQTIDLERELTLMTRPTSDQVRNLDGFVGGWAGVCLEKPSFLVTRSDWASPEALRAFLLNEDKRGLREWYRSHATLVEDASFHLQKLITLPLRSQ